MVDTSVWVDHLRVGDADLAARLQGLPKARVAEDDEVLRLIEQRKLYGRGIGYVDAHLLAAVLLTPGSRLWARDRRLLNVATTMGPVLV